MAALLLSFTLTVAVVLYLLFDRLQRERVIRAQSEIIENQASVIASLKVSHKEQESALRVFCGIDAPFLGWAQDERFYTSAYYALERRRPN